jgi:hypothetical protein
LPDLIGIESHLSIFRFPDPRNSSFSSIRIRRNPIKISTGTHFQITVEWYGADGAKCNDRFPHDALVAAQPAEPEPEPDVMLSVPSMSRGGLSGYAMVRLDTLIETLRMQGYEVHRK